MNDPQIEVRKLSELRHPERNARMHPDKQIAELKRSLEKDGQTRLMVIDENGVIWIGNGLYTAMVEMGLTEAWCIVKTGMSENDKKKMMLSDNRIFDLGVDDMKAFDAIIAELGDDLDVPGFDDELLQSLNADAEEIDEMMSSYGLITDEKKEELAGAEQTYRQEEAARAARPVSAPAQNAAPSDDPEPEGFVICPNCGEKIWL